MMNCLAPSSAALAPPSWLLLGTEPLRAAIEFAGLKRIDRKALPEGDGHTVVMFPGLASDRRAMSPLRRFCESLGYATADWGRGLNTGPEGDVDAWLDALTHDIASRCAGQRRKVSLLGWSLGGVYAREVAKRWPRGVRQVITLGTPFAGPPESTHAGLVYRLLNGESPAMDDAMRSRLMTAPPVPTTSIYSRRDGIVAWGACLQPADHPQCENIEVEGSHCGLGWNARALSVVADRLAQRPGSWRPYVRRAAA